MSVTMTSSDDKWVKLRPLFDVVNKNLIQFGVFAEYLSIDEQMVPYFGWHFCEMFIRANQFVLARKLGIMLRWWLSFRFNHYQGKAERNEGPLKPTTVKNLLDVVTDDRIHDVYFDNFFTSVPLLEKFEFQQEEPSVSTDCLDCLHPQTKRWEKRKED